MGFCVVLPNEPDQPDPPLTRILDPGGQPDPPLFATLRDQPDSTRFLTLMVGFNPIQPFNPKYNLLSSYCVVCKAHFFFYFVASPKSGKVLIHT